MDGSPIVLKRDDFVGFDSIPIDGPFHVVTIQAPMTTTTAQTNQQLAHRHGFVAHNDIDAGWMIAHRFDPLTEEVSATPIDATAHDNLEAAVRAAQLEPSRIVSYTQLLNGTTNNNNWEEMTNRIDSTLLKKRRIPHGTKVVPGSFGDHHDTTTASEVPNAPIIDGQSLVYPPIPVLGSGNTSLLRHAGTKAFLSKLSPTQRTAFVTAGDATQLLSTVLELYYDNQWSRLLGDVQLAHVMFLHLQCFSSFEHWRDLIAMLSFAAEEGEEESNAIDEYTDLYQNLATLLQLQMKTMDKEFFADLEYAKDNFFLPAMERICKSMLQSGNQSLQREGEKLQTAASSLLPSSGAALDEQIAASTIPMDDDSDEDGPVVVSAMEYEALLARTVDSQPEKRHHSQQYPLLFAAIQPHEDVLMTCARALDTHTDVSLVREAAAYLEQVEATRQMDDE